MLWLWVLPLIVLIAVLVWVVFSASKRTRPLQNRRQGEVLKDEPNQDPGGPGGRPPE